MSSRYIFDTNIYIQCLQDREFAIRFEAEYARRISFTFFCSVVVQELLLGCTHHLAVKRVQAFYKPFERVNRIISPLYQDWEEAGVVGLKIVKKYPSLKAKRFALINDILIARCCHRVGAILVTRDSKDFKIISTVKPVRFQIWE